MIHFILTAVTEDGTGYDHSWGDRYEVHAASYDDAREHVLGLEGTRGSKPYALIVKAWAKREPFGWDQLDPATGEPLP